MPCGIKRREDRKLLDDLKAPNHIPAQTARSLSRAWYQASVERFIASSDSEVIGDLALVGNFDLKLTQRDAWIAQLEILRTELRGLRGEIFVEFDIPRMGRRVDTVLIAGPAVFVIEFKVGERSFDQAAIDQVWDYALDLKNFHRASHELPIVPILIATNGRAVASKLIRDADEVYRPLCAGAAQLREVIDLVLDSMPHARVVDPQEWATSSYHPSPSIVEAARALYANHSVEAIARSDAGAQNLAVTSAKVEALVETAKRKKQKIICFVTGVPGAGKTLVGLNVATRRQEADKESHAVFLSGNGPLVSVLREALTRDEVVRRKAAGESVRKGEVAEKVKGFIQNVHHFRDDALVDLGAPVEHVVVFDEAQRAWNLAQTAAFMQRKKGQPGFSKSEPEFLISCLDRHGDWCVVVCLVGGGQEINIGEAGISEWLHAIDRSFPDWDVHISDQLKDSEYAAGGALTSLKARKKRVFFDSDLHLSVSMRSFRAEHVSLFVKAVLDCEKDVAVKTLAEIRGRYPILISRNLNDAKDWVRSRARGSERFGLVASSRAQRLKPYAVDIRVNVDPIHYFLNDRTDTRSSFYLEDAATEFQVQGLELDWTCVTWDADLRFMPGGWSFHDFRGSRWTNVNSAENRNYLKNAYRVLLTRARQGMVIFVPPGDKADATRQPAMYDATYSYLRSIGIPEL